MQTPPADLPDNIAELKAIIARQADDIPAVDTPVPVLDPGR